MTISGKKTNAKHFAFDGCHKFYLLESDKDISEAMHNSYSVGIFPIDELPEKFFNSCPLRFIESWADFKIIVPQCRQNVTFRNIGHITSVKVDFKKNEIIRGRV